MGTSARPLSSLVRCCCCGGGLSGRSSLSFSWLPYKLEKKADDTGILDSRNDASVVLLVLPWLVLNPLDTSLFPLLLPPRVLPLLSPRSPLPRSPLPRSPLPRSPLPPLPLPPHLPLLPPPLCRPPPFPLNGDTGDPPKITSRGGDLDKPGFNELFKGLDGIRSKLTLLPSIDGLMSESPLCKEPKDAVL